jgi:protein SCO1/2
MTLRGAAARVVLLGIALSVHPSAAAERQSDDTSLPAAVRDVDIDEHLGARLDSSLAFVDAAGRPVTLGNYLGDGKPIILSLAYFRCPMLCGLVLGGLAKGLGGVPFVAGEDYHLLTISFDPKDRPTEAALKQAAALRSLGQGAGARAWSFLVGDTDAIRAVADVLGFRFAYDTRSEQYAHPAAAFVLTSDGRISRYLYGADFAPRDLRLALVEAGSGKVGTIVDRILLTCYKFDPATRRFGPFIRGFMRIGASLIFLVVSITVALLFRAERRRARAASSR